VYPGHAGDEQTVHYVYERDSFVPLVQATQGEALRLAPSTDIKSLIRENYGKYDVALDPLWNGELELEAKPFDTNEIVFYQCDHLGTPLELTDRDGKVAWSAQYKAWGHAKETISEAAHKAGMRNPIRFQGQYFDQETALHYNRYRYYDPRLGRFLSRDPIGLSGGILLYEYAANPTEYIDPLGLARYLVIGEGQASVEAYAAAMRIKFPCQEFRTIKKDWSSIVRRSGAPKFDQGSKEWEEKAVGGNAAWIRERATEGYEFIDIGNDSAVNRSPFYAAEKRALGRTGAKIFRSNRCATKQARNNATTSNRPASKGRYGTR
jgi:RHS repeat-associated protein